MLSFDEGEEFFFDTVDCLSAEQSVVEEENLGSNNLGYQIWMNELQSVSERRESFLRGMGFLQFTSAHDPSDGDGSETLGLKRIKECSGAVSSSSALLSRNAEGNLGFDRRDVNGEANCMIDELSQDLSDDLNIVLENECVHAQTQAHLECKNSVMQKKKMMWWKQFLSKRLRNPCKYPTEVFQPSAVAPTENKLKVKQNKKSCVELSALFAGQEVQAHNGLIWAMKFSPDGKYLATGGKDGLVRVWHVTLADAGCRSFNVECSVGRHGKHPKSSFGRKKSCHASVVIPDRVFQIEELPLQEFHGHTSDVLDLAWSQSNQLLSSSKDKTVRLWQVGGDECLGVFHHSDFVTCIQFNPEDESQFVSGSIDGKVRIWGVHERRVVDWADARDVITAICYQQDGKGLVVGSITGACRFYQASGSGLQLNADIQIHSRKKSSSNRITGIQFLEKDSQRVMVTSEDSKVHILDGMEVVHKYKGLSRSRSQMSASFTSSGRHIISAGEDSRVYLWNYDGLSVKSSKQRKSIRCCEHFVSEGVSVALPYSVMRSEKKVLGCDRFRSGSEELERLKAASCSRDSGRFSLLSWFSMDGSCRSSGSSATWPEESFHLWDVLSSEHDHTCDLLPHNIANCDWGVQPLTWGLAIVTAGSDGRIRTFHNFGLPLKI